MTCVAYDGSILAWDGVGTDAQGFQGGNREKDKCRYFEGLWICFAGTNEEMHFEAMQIISALYKAIVYKGEQVLRFDTAVAVTDSLRPMEVWPAEHDIDAMVIDPKYPGVVWTWMSKTPRGLTPEYPPYAMGSGFRYAMGAMAAGASARSAVDITTVLDAYTGGTVQSANMFEQ